MSTEFRSALTIIVIISFSAVTPLLIVDFLMNQPSWSLYFPSTGWVPAWLLTIYYSVITTFFQLIIGVYLALYFYLHRFDSHWKRYIVLTLALLPYSIPPTITVMMFGFGLDENGYLNNIIETLGLISMPLQSSPLGRFASLCVVSIWQYFPFFFVVATVSFNSIPRGIIRQAEIDGASSTSIAYDILLPCSYHALIAATILRLVLMIGKIDIALAIHKKSFIPGAETLPVQIVEKFFEFNSKAPFGLVLGLGIMLLVPVILYSFSLRKSPNE